MIKKKPYAGIFLVLLISTAAFADTGVATERDSSQTTACDMAKDSAQQAGDFRHIERISESRDASLSIMPCECKQTDEQWECSVRWMVQ